MVNNYTNTCINKTSLNSLNIKKTMTYNVGNPGPVLRQAQKSGMIKLVNGILILIHYIESLLLKNVNFSKP
jgi:hypothetical protein